MRSFTGSRPSPAIIVAVVALSFALVGTAVAGTDGLSEKITKSKVKKIAKRQANKAINKREASLNVNSAITANSATDATNATNVNGLTMHSVSFAVEGVVGPTVILDNFNGLTLTASCAAGPTLSVEASTSVDGAQFNSLSMVTPDIVTNGVTEDDFLIGAPLNLLPDDTDLQNGKTEYLNPDGKHVSVSWAADNFATGPDCEFNGVAIG